MPKYVPSKQPLGLLAWGVIVLALGAMAYGAFKHPVLLVIVPIFVVWTYVGNKMMKRKFDALALERQSLGICEYARALEFRNLDTWVIRAVYEQVQEYVGPIPIKPDDDLFELLEIDEEDLEFDMLAEIAQRTKRSLENTENNPYYGKVRTVRDLVHFIDAQPRLKDA
jgi:hypothetical protein